MALNDQLGRDVTSIVKASESVKPSQVLKFKSLPHLDSLQVSSLSLVKDPDRSETPPESFPVQDVQVRSNESSVFQKMFQIASIQELASVQELGEANDEQKLESIPPGPYRDLMSKYPDLLKPNFKTETPKNKIIHRIPQGISERERS